MKVRLLVARAVVQQPGDEIEVPADEGRRMISLGQAQPVRRRKPERAVPDRQSEKAVK